MQKKRAAELVLLFFIAPGVLALLKPHGWIYMILWLMAALAARTLENHYDHTVQRDWNWKGVTREALGFIFMRFIFFAIALGFFAWTRIPEHFFTFPRERFIGWIVMILLYPPLSAYPQEIVFRSYFFRRFSSLFKTPTAMIIASGIAFGWVHILLLNWVAVVFAAIGGMLFAHTYQKTHSLAAVYIEHALYGCWIFTIGMGVYFYHGLAVH